MRESAEQFQVILRSIADAITVQDATGQLIYANEAAARTIGYPSVQSLLQTPLADVMRRFEIMDGAGQPFPLARLPGRLALQGEPSPETILRFRVVDTGEERWSAVKTTPIFDERGEVRFAVSIFQDVTVRQQAERRLAMQLAVTRLLAEAATFDAAAPRILEAIGQGLGWEWGAVWRMDRHAGLLHCAEVWHASWFSAAGFEEITRQISFPPGVGLPGHVWHSAEPIWVTDLATAPGFLRRQAAAEVGLHGGLFLPIASGREFIGVLELCSRVIRPPDDELLAMLSAIGSQIGQFVERKRAEDALRFLAEASTVLATALEYETTLRSVAHLAVPTFADLCLVDVVAEDHSIRRVAAAANVALTDETLKGILPGCPSEASCPEGVAKVLRTGEPALYPELSEGQLATTEGACHLRTLYRLGVRSIVIVPLVAGGRSLGAISFAVGESGRRYGPDDLPLVEAIARRAALAVDNARLYREAQAAIQFQNELLSTVSHDLRNPLATIKGWAQLLRRQAVQAGVPGMDRLIAGLANIDATATRMVALINELLDLARHQVGEPLDLDCHPVDLVALARQVADEQRPGADRHEIRVEASVPELTGTWDPVRLERVLANLLANAIKYSPQGGEVTVTVARQQDAVGDWAVVEVRDQGLGIPAADLPHIFERYRRGANVVGRISGVGIGLTSVRHIVEQHGGTMAVSSEEGVGSTFTVRLPLSPEHASTD